MRKTFFSLFVILFAGIAICGVLSASSAEEEAPEGKWLGIKSNSLTIYCAQSVDLKTVADKLHNRGLFESGVYDPNPASAPTEKVAYRLDRILKRVKEILDMYPRMQLNVKIFKDREELSGEYYKIFDKQADYKAFYIDQHKTIYTSEEDISDSVVSHEMAHAVVDNYFAVIPPEKIREMLARYVDLHLEED